jgi:hypothetical protein
MAMMEEATLAAICNRMDADNLSSIFHSHKTKTDSKLGAVYDEL